MYERFYSPNIMALASSQVGEDSLSVRVFSLDSQPPDMTCFTNMCADLRR
jgi:hypothetical protein